MAKELYLYSPIYDTTSEALVSAMEEAKNDDIILRINSDGGSPEMGWGVIAKFAEHPGKKSIKVDGKANSMAAFFLAYTNNVEALDVSEFIFHRAAYPKWIESDSDFMTEAMWENLDRVNSKLRQALEAKIDVDKFEKLKGVSMDELFSNDTRIDVALNATQAKKIGLINSIVKITPERKAEINAMTMKLAANYNGFDKPINKDSIIDEPEKIINNTKISEMTIETLKAENPKLYKEIYEKGIESERDRVGSWATFLDVDPEKVVKAIKEGDELTATQMAELTRKSVNAKVLGNIESDNTDAIETDEEKKAKTEKENKVEAFEKEVKINLGLNKEN